jgi:hypothetical protein
MTSLLFTLLLTSTASAQEIHPDILQKKWKSFWISVPGESADGYGVYNFRNTIDLPEKPATFTIHVSADNRYKLFINEKEVSHGPARGDLFHYNFETIDIAPYLKAGKNVLAAVVWNFGDHRPEPEISFRTAFILQGNSEKEASVNTGKNWKCIRDSSYQAIAPKLIYTYYVAGPGEKIDYNKKIVGWTSESYDDRNWKNGHEITAGLPKGVFEWANGWMLVPRPIAQMEMTIQRFGTARQSEGLTLPKGFPATTATLTIPANQKIRLLIDNNHLTNAYPILQFSKGKESVIKISYAEALYLNENSPDWRAEKQKGNRNDVNGKRFVGVTDELISNGAESQVFSPLVWRTFRYVELLVETKNEALLIDDLYSIFTGYPFKFNAELKTSDQKLDALLTTGWRTARLCAVETYMDCPYYEQLQYVGDTRIQALVSLYNSGDDKLVRNAINQLDHSRLAEGITLSRYPSATPQQIPTFSLWWIGMVHDYWMYRPDPDFVRGKLTGVRNVLDFFSRYQQEDGSLKDAPYWEFTDWAEGEGWYRGMAPLGKDGNGAVLDLQLCWAYKLAAELEKALGMNDFAQQYQQAADKLAETIKSKYWSASRQLFGDTPEQQLFSQHVNTLAVLAGILPSAETQPLMEKVLSDTSLTQATIYFKYYVHQAAAKAGLGDRYLTLLGDWHDQLANGLTTWAEISDHNNSRSDCHAWGSSPNIELFRIVLGIDTGSPGFETVKIKPHLGALPEASGKIPHPQGEISVRYFKSKGKWKAEISLPNETPGTFYWKEKQYDLKAGEKTLLSL